MEEEVEEKRTRDVIIYVNGKATVVPERIPVREALSFSGHQEMMEIWSILKDTGLKIVLCQTAYGHVGP